MKQVREALARALPAREARLAAAEAFNLFETVEWLWKDGRISLHQGEPSRLILEQARHMLNWSLFVRSKMDSPPFRLQWYPDHGPKTRKGKAGESKGSGQSQRRR